MRQCRPVSEATCSFVVACTMALLLAGCGDDSRTSGTMLQVSPEAKAAQNDTKSAMQEQRRERQAERQKGRGKKGATKAPTASKDTGKAPQ